MDNLDDYIFDMSSLLLTVNVVDDSAGETAAGLHHACGVAHSP